MKKLINKEFAKRLQAAIDDGKAKIKKYKFNDTYERFLIGKVYVVKVKDRCQLELPHDVNKLYMTPWHNDVGEYFAKDLKSTKGENIFELITKVEHALLYKIPHEEFEKIEENGFAYLKIGDFYYMIIKCIPIKESYALYDNSEKEIAEIVETLNESSNIIPEEDLKSPIESEVESSALF